MRLASVAVLLVSEGLFPLAQVAWPVERNLYAWLPWPLSVLSWDQAVRCLVRHICLHYCCLYFPGGALSQGFEHEQASSCSYYARQTSPLATASSSSPHESLISQLRTAASHRFSRVKGVYSPDRSFVAPLSWQSANSSSVTALIAQLSNVKKKSLPPLQQHATVAVASPVGDPSPCGTQTHSWRPTLLLALHLTVGNSPAEEISLLQHSSAPATSAAPRDSRVCMRKHAHREPTLCLPAHTTLSHSPAT